eukprot:TRINITY_DN8329_c0_g2_i1.p1 TRINITY_DN8329_c0_g2~~TRINITY_DN8329_c0_g2_i1.p1  ORF type:complete len:812 (+),score=118.65 TRINITY_DN8329_c0_g2_i1:131-2566(+)
MADPADSISGQWHAVLQLVVTYYAASLWFSKGLLGVWKDVLEYQYPIVSPFLSERGLVPNETVALDMDRWPSVMAVSGWHTALVLFGLVLGNSLKRLKLQNGICLGLIAAVSVAVSAFYGLQVGYDTNTGGVRSFARALYWPEHVKDSCYYFAVLGSASMFGWIMIAMSLAVTDPDDKGLASAQVARYLPRIVGFYILSLVFFRFGCIPLWNNFGTYSPLTLGLAIDRGNIDGGDLDIISMTRLASTTHTLSLMLGVATCSVTNKVLRRMPCRVPGDTNQEVRTAVSNIAVLSVLSLGFIMIFANWVSFALSNGVSHVVNFSESFFGPGAVAEAAAVNWSSVHSLVTLSYTTWFAGGVVFEQAWSGSSTNTVRGQAIPHPQTGISIKIFTVSIILVVLPIAWRAGFFGAIGLVVLLWPQRGMPKSERYQWGGIPADSFKKKSWEQATSDCPKTGAKYVVIGVGFVGINLVKKLLERGETNITCFDISPKNPFEGTPEVKYVRGDVTNLESVTKALKGAHTVYATFAIIRFWERLDFQKRLSERINIHGTENVIKACQTCGVKNLIQTSTSNVFAAPCYNNQNMTEDNSPYVEANSPSCINHYGWTKAKAEQAVLAANTSKGLRTISVRPCSGVFGVNDKTLIERFVTSRMLVVTFPKERIDWVFVENVVLGHLKAEARLNDSASKVSGQAFNINNGTGKTFSYYEMAEGFYKIYNRRGFFQIISPDYFLVLFAHFIEFVAKVTNGAVTFAAISIDFVTPATLATAGMEFSSNGGKASQMLNYDPIYSVEEAMQKVVYQLQQQESSKKLKTA